VVTDQSAEARAAHPGPPSVTIPAEMRAAMVDHARHDYPNEMCGIVAGSAEPAVGGRPTRWYPARNELASPLRYSIASEDKLRIFLEIDDNEEVVWAIVHSHVRSPAVPSMTDVGLAQWPETLYVLVSLAEDEADPTTGEPSLRAWRIVDGVSHEVAVTTG
jgi:[CysO sulfur-carrier protein]-S-L-cysteine hydrolase